MYSVDRCRTVNKSRRGRTTTHAHAYTDEDPPISPHRMPTPEPPRPVISTKYKSSSPTHPPPHLLRRSQTDTTTTIPSRSNGIRGGGRKLMRVDHAFDAESDSEMSILPGEIVAVIEEVDVGWFIGEIVGDEQRSGMFPSTYCTVVDTTPPPLAPSSSTRRTPLKPPSPTKSDNGDGFGDMEEQLSSLSLRKSSIQQRPIVPRSKSSGSTAIGTAAAKKKAPPPPPVSRGSKPTISNTLTNSSASSTAVCRECGCEEFRANVFKKGSCNNCFHVHHSTTM